MQVTIKVLVRGGCSHFNAQEKGSLSNLTHLAVGRLQFLTACWTEGLVPLWLLTRGHLRCFPDKVLHWGAHTCSGFHQNKLESERRHTR